MSLTLLNRGVSDSRWKAGGIWDLPTGTASTELMRAAMVRICAVNFMMGVEKIVDRCGV